MHYAIGDIHNEAKKLDNILDQIRLKDEDELFLLGDVFDRGGDEADPVGTYFLLSGIQGKCIWIKGNHDQWLSNYILKYYTLSERKRKAMFAYPYNSFDLLKQRMTETDMWNLAERIQKLPVQKEIDVAGKKFLCAHAMTSDPLVWYPNSYYMMGNDDRDAFFLEGIDGYISLCGHTPTCSLLWKNKGAYLDEYMKSIWRNEKESVYLLDCGCGFSGGRLACMCIETGDRFYSENA